MISARGIGFGIRCPPPSPLWRGVVRSLVDERRRIYALVLLLLLSRTDDGVRIWDCGGGVGELEFVRQGL